MTPHAGPPSPHAALRLFVIAAFETCMACSRRPTAAVEHAGGPALPTGVTSAAPPPASGMVLASVAERALPSVVSVASTRTVKVEAPDLPLDNPFFRHFFGPGPSSPFGGQGQSRVEHGLGSGVLVGKDKVLTNAHVVEGASELDVTTYDQRKLKAKVTGSDPESDLAVLAISGDVSELRPLSFADSDQLRLGEFVLAIGNPFGVGQTVTMGIVSAKGRADLGIEPYEDFIQTDAAINPGNSGGALVDLNGNLVGIPTAILSRSGGYMGVGFAIPSNMARPIMASLIEHGRVDRGYLGVSIQPIDESLAKALDLPSTEGILVSEVARGGPAERAGVRRGDVILSINGQRMTSTGQLRNVVAAAGVAKAVKLELVRQRAKLTLNVTLGSSPRRAGDKAASEPATPSAESAGLALSPLTPAARQRLAVPSWITQGVLIEDVMPGSPAADAGLRPGDVILEFDHQPVADAASVARLWAQAKGTVAVLALREDRTFFAAIKH
jgi:serine protease Do